MAADLIPIVEIGGRNHRLRQRGTWSRALIDDQDRSIAAALRMVLDRLTRQAA